MLLPRSSERCEMGRHQRLEFALRLAAMELHPLHDLIVVVDLKRGREIKEDFLLILHTWKEGNEIHRPETRRGETILRHFAIDHRFLVRVDDNERQWDTFALWVMRLAVALHQILERHLLRQQFLQVETLLVEPFLARRQIHLQTRPLLLRVGWQTAPHDIFLFLRDDVHRHQHVESIVHSPSDVLFIVCLVKR